MYNTVNTKIEQLKNGYFKTGTGNELVLIIGSCRSVPYINYFHENNKNNRFTICFIDPFNWNFDVNDNRIDMQEKITSLEVDENILSMLRSAAIFVHEFYSNFGMFNCDKTSEKNIYQFGLNPEIDICIPNFNDLFILFKDIITFDSDMRRLAAQDFNVLGKLSEQTEHAILEVGMNNIAKFKKVCELSDLPDMWKAFYAVWTRHRLFWSYNHVSKDFTLIIFDLINQQYFNGSLTVDKKHADMFANNFTCPTQYDVKHYGITWNEPIKKLEL